LGKETGLECVNCGSADDLCGHEIQGVYDGVLFWSCLACGRAWPRDFGDWERLNTASAEYAERHNEGK
jgi:hypothetical protein